MNLSAYIFETIRNDDEFRLLRGRQPGRINPSSVLVLSPVAAQPALGTIEKIKREFSLCDALDPSWALHPVDLSQYCDQPALVFLDPGGETLDRLSDGPMEVGLFFRLAVGIATALGGLHKGGLIHKDIKPQNVLADAATGQVWLTGFGIASRLPRERQISAPPESIAGSLAYIAPEQTGRMNRSVDSRSDLYALGVTLYEMLTGRLPFSASDPMEWVHCHVARQAVSPSQSKTEVPGAVSAIIMKLLAKAPEDRYQTAKGVEHDLRHCLDEWNVHGRITDFPLGEHDVPDRLLIPEKLYGREREIEILLGTFDRIVAGGRAEMVLVSGYSGVGKSSVVNELHKALVPPRGFFASGKFDQDKRDVPYGTLAQAFRRLIHELLRKRDAELTKWRDAFREALGPNGRLVMDLVPELGLIIGEQPPAPELPVQDARRRFLLVLRRFIEVFARPEHPLALFLDDLQWLDVATLDLIEELLTATDIRHLMLIGAYRDNEVSSSHPLIRKLETMRLAGAGIQNIVLKPLTQGDVELLVADSLHCEPGFAASLAQLIHDKTAGNPFFAIQFIYTLAEEELLTFNHGGGRWSWDLNRIRAKGYTDNVVHLMIDKLNRLPVETQNALKLFACFGNSTEFSTLRMLYPESEEEIHRRLWEAVRSGLILHSEDSYSFLHDRVREAAYSLIAEQARAEAHLQIGRLLALRTPSHKREERIFEIVNQLNRASQLIESNHERKRVAGFNLTAARRAKSSIAYVSALTYLATARTLMTAESWETDYQLVFSLECLTAECELLTADMESAENRLSIIAARANTAHDLAIVIRMQLMLYAAIDRLDRGIEICLEYFRRDGTNWLAHPTDQDVQREYDQIWSLMGNRQIEDLIDAVVVASPDVLDVLEVLTELVTPAAFFDQNLCAFVVCRIVNLSLEHGNDEASCFAYVWLGIIGGPRFGNYKDAFRFAQLGYDLLEKRGLKRYEARICLCFAVVVPGMKHVRHCRALVRNAFDVAHRMGDFTYAAYSFTQLITNFLVMGDSLAEAQAEAEKGVEFAKAARVGLVVNIVASDLQLIRALRGLTNKFGSFDDKEFDEARFEQHLASNSALADAGFGYWTLKAEVRFFAGDYASAVAASLKAQQLLWSAPALLERAAFRFYGALSSAAAWGSATSDERQEHLDVLRTHHKELEIWAEHCSENFEDRAVLVSAEIARIEGLDLDAMRLYEQAIRSARTNGFVHNEGVANEVAARFYAARGLHKVANVYLRDARYCYQRWGADGKVRQLEQMHPELKTEASLSTPTSTIVAATESLDLATVVKVSQAISSEVIFEKLMDTLMRMAIEYAGADRGLLLLPDGAGYRIEAEAITNDQGPIVRLRSESVETGNLPLAIVHYVTRTRKSVILDDASTSSDFRNDPYVIQHRSRSILCLPLIAHTNIAGVIYLENKLAPNVFTAARMAVLNVIASQAAISLTNSYLYRQQKEAEAALRRSEAYLTEAQILSHTGSCGWKVSSGELFWSTETYRIAGIDPAINPTLELVRQITHPEDRATVQQAIEKATREGVDFDLEHRIVRPDGSISNVHVVMRAAKDHKGEVEYIGALTDVTRTKADFQQIEELKDQLQRENVALREEVDAASMFEEIIGTSASLRAVLSRVSKVAPTDSTVLITGETGTGKELIARAIHKRSARASQPFISVNCAAIPPSLIHSELFGHEKGSFTGATQRKLGRFELARGGTFFLDEVGELPLETQVALLRVLQENEFERVGGSQPICADVRLIAATNRDLKEAIASGVFRRDLFYRLNVFPIEMPPLRDRNEDIPILTEYFIHRFARRMGKKISGIGRKTSELFQTYRWPGNIRELQNVVERSVIVCETETFSVDESWFARQTPPTEAIVRPLSHMPPKEEKSLIEGALAETRGRVSGPSGAAVKLGLPASTLESKILVLKIDKHQFKHPPESH